jgi:hypothetical protein
MATNTYQGGARGQTTVWSSLENDSIRVSPEIEAKIRKIVQRRVPFTTIIDKVNNSVPSKQFEFQWMEEWGIEHRTTVTTATTAVATEVVVAKVDIVLPGMHVFNARTHEVMRVTAVTTATSTLTVVRGIGSNARAINANDPLLLGPIVIEEGQDPVQMLMRGTDNGTLYLQEDSWAVGLSTWEMLSEKRGGGEEERLSEQALRAFGENKEWTAIFGTPDKTPNATTSLPVYSSGGLLYFCSQHNLIDLNKRVSWSGLARAMGRIFEFGESKTRVAVTSRNGLLALAEIPEFQKSIQRTSKETEYGFEVTDVVMPGGLRLRFVESPALNDQYVDNQILVTSMADFRKRTHAKRPGMWIDRDIQTRGSKRKEWQMSEIYGFEHTNTLAAGRIYNLF